MLKKETQLGVSTIEGIGLFSVDFIKAGEEVWMFDGDFDRSFTLEEGLLLPKETRHFLERYAYVSRHSGRIILCTDNARFMNHSDLYNLQESQDIKNGEPRDIAIRDIFPGEELTCDYTAFAKEFDDDFDIHWLSCDVID
jgi:uncharacterized protein